MPPVLGATRKLAGQFYNFGELGYNTKHPNSEMICDGVADDRAALNTLVNVTMQPNGGQLHVVGVVRIGSNLTIPANVVPNFAVNGSLAPDVGVTLTISGPVSASRRQIFSGLGTVLFGVTGQQDFVYPEWFGAKGDSDGAGGGTNDAPAFSKALAALIASAKPSIGPSYGIGGSVGAIDCAATRYRMSTAFAPANSAVAYTVRGKGTKGMNAGQVATSFVFDVGVAGVRLLAQADPPPYAQHPSIFEGIEFAAADRRTGAVVDGFYSEIPFILRDFNIRQFAGTGLKAFTDTGTPATANVNRSSVRDGTISLCGKSGVWIEGSDGNVISFADVLSGDNLEYGFRDDSKYGIQCFNCETAANTLGGFNNTLGAADPLFERQTTLIGCYDGDGPVLSKLRYPAVIVGGALAFQTKVTTTLHEDAAVWPPIHGFFVPTLVPSVSGSVQTNAAFTGARWTKTGRQVTIVGTALVSGLTAPVGTITIQGLAGALDDTGRPAPWLTPANRQTLYSGFLICASGYNVAITGGLAGRILPGTLSFEINKVVAGGIVPFLGSDLLVGTEFYFEISYTVGD